MKPLKEITSNFEQKGHRTLLLALLMVLRVNPFVQQLDKFQWLLVVILATVLLAAANTRATKTNKNNAI